MQFKKQQLERDMELHSSNLGKEYIKTVYCHPTCLTVQNTSMQSTSCKTLGWMKQKPESRLLQEISVTSDMQMTILMAENEELKTLSMKRKEESGKAGLKLNIHEMKIMASIPITSWQIDEKQWKQ